MTDDDSGSGSSGQKLDLPMGGETGDGAAEQGTSDDCEKIDFLFVIDDSRSMDAAQDALREAFPQFAASILENVGVDDHHVMVVDSDDKVIVQPECDDWSSYFDYDPDVAENACDLQFGAGNTIRTERGQFGPTLEIVEEYRCEIPDGRRYLESSDPGFESAFDCISRVSTTGSWRERMMSSMVAALDEQAHACNSGFLRDDAILVVTILTDDFAADSCVGDAEASPAQVQGWVDTLLAAKGGQEEAVTVILVHDMNLDVPNFTWFATLLGDRAVEAPIYDVAGEVSDFGQIFEDAVVKVQESCEEFVPVD